ncbi:unnamed protein product [Vitrella brassicaformis CCMP3155]|uniref:Uncharacterized protein n=2 Tax=Vitrella brassicaformis TaxID=1169539 RepID=A0A0G4GRU3_VITBC|nr:unnamed protein product [Vitrella brassicaformis CCMP3155]|eukprot:CEM33334.1 unnamed protein product [Vitrella brassicaformis CCMP3155]
MEGEAEDCSRPQLPSQQLDVSPPQETEGGKDSRQMTNNGGPSDDWCADGEESDASEMAGGEGGAAAKKKARPKKAPPKKSGDGSGRNGNGRAKPSVCPFCKIRLNSQIESLSRHIAMCQGSCARADDILHDIELMVKDLPPEERPIITPTNRHSNRQPPPVPDHCIAKSRPRRQAALNLKYPFKRDGDKRPHAEDENDEANDDSSRNNKGNGRAKSKGKSAPATPATKPLMRTRAAKGGVADDEPSIEVGEAYRDSRAILRDCEEAMRALADAALSFDQEEWHRGRHETTDDEGQDEGEMDEDPAADEEVDSEWEYAKDSRQRKGDNKHKRAKRRRIAAQPQEEGDDVGQPRPSGVSMDGGMDDAGLQLFAKIVARAQTNGTSPADFSQEPESKGKGNDRGEEPPVDQTAEGTTQDNRDPDDAALRLPLKEPGQQQQNRSHESALPPLYSLAVAALSHPKASELLAELQSEGQLPIPLSGQQGEALQQQLAELLRADGKATFRPSNVRASIKAADEDHSPMTTPERTVDPGATNKNHHQQHHPPLSEGDVGNNGGGSSQKRGRSKSSGNDASLAAALADDGIDDELALAFLDDLDDDMDSRPRKRRQVRGGRKGRGQGAARRKTGAAHGTSKGKRGRGKANDGGRRKKAAGKNGESTPPSLLVPPPPLTDAADPSTSPSQPPAPSSAHPNQESKSVLASSSPFPSPFFALSDEDQMEWQRLLRQKAQELTFMSRRRKKADDDAGGGGTSAAPADSLGGPSASLLSILNRRKRLQQGGDDAEAADDAESAGDEDKPKDGASPAARCPFTFGRPPPPYPYPPPPAPPPDTGWGAPPYPPPPLHGYRPDGPYHPAPYVPPHPPYAAIRHPHFPLMHHPMHEGGFAPCNCPECVNARRGGPPLPARPPMWHQQHAAVDRGSPALKGEDGGVGDGTGSEVSMPDGEYDFFPMEGETEEAISSGQGIYFDSHTNNWFVPWWLDGKRKTRTFNKGRYGEHAFTVAKDFYCVAKRWGLMDVNNRLHARSTGFDPSKAYSALLGKPSAATPADSNNSRAESAPPDAAQDPPEEVGAESQQPQVGVKQQEDGPSDGLSSLVAAVTAMSMAKERQEKEAVSGDKRKAACLKSEPDAEGGQEEGGSRPPSSKERRVDGDPRELSAAPTSDAAKKPIQPPSFSSPGPPLHMPSPLSAQRSPHRPFPPPPPYPLVFPSKMIPPAAALSPHPHRPAFMAPSPPAPLFRMPNAREPTSSALLHRGPVGKRQAGSPRGVFWDPFTGAWCVEWPCQGHIRRKLFPVQQVQHDLHDKERMARVYYKELAEKGWLVPLNDQWDDAHFTFYKLFPNVMRNKPITPSLNIDMSGQHGGGKKASRVSKSDASSKSDDRQRNATPAAEDHDTAKREEPSKPTDGKDRESQAAPPQSDSPFARIKTERDLEGPRPAISTLPPHTPAFGYPNHIPFYGPPPHSAHEAAPIRSPTSTLLPRRRPDGHVPMLSLGVPSYPPASMGHGWTGARPPPAAGGV